MALISCGECGKQISTAAVACPYCGWRASSFASLKEKFADTNPEQRGKQIQTIFGIAGALIFVATGWYFLAGGVQNSVATGKSKEQMQQEAAESAKLDGEKKMTLFREKVLAKLKDPSSAQFKDLVFISGPGGEEVCGQVNSKNAYGGYVGFTPFVVVSPRDQSVEGAVIIVTTADEPFKRFEQKKLIKTAGCPIYKDVEIRLIE